MARPRSGDKREAITTAAIRVIAAQGLAAPTALIAKEAGVSNGSLFTYFATKADLFNHVYVYLKAAMASAAMKGLPAEAGVREQFLHVWSNWVGWAVAHPDHRRTLSQLGVSDEITPASRSAGHKAMAEVSELVERVRANGPMKEAPKRFVAAILNSLAETTMDYIAQDPGNLDQHCKIGFNALWRVLA
jgi:AcrR family transcriptional regulator